MGAPDDTPIFIGDELTAAGYRLAGARVETPAPDDIATSFERAKRSARLVLITSEYAARLSARALEPTGDLPLVLVVSDARRRAPLPELGIRVRRELGIEP